MSNSQIITRFAPSPTGFVHIGSLRTCLYNYLYSKKHHGKCILRLEDTDQTRLVEGAAENMVKVFQDLGIEFDEGPVKIAPNSDLKYNLEQIGANGPYIQSERTEIYQKYAQQLIESGHAYYCFTTPEELDQMRKEQQEAGLAPMYDRRALKLTPEEIQANLAAEKPHVIRLKMPRDQKIEFQDKIRGKVSFMGNQIDDQVLIKSDGMPTYHLACVVDDHLMGVTDVIRGEDWLASTPKHIVMFRAFGWETPRFAHIPLILNADKSKLSKRQNDVSVESYLQKGYLKEALLNYMALLGWHPGKGVETEIFSLDELIEFFSLEGVHKGGAIFDLEKLNWFNWQWQKRKFYGALDQVATEIDPQVHIETDKRDNRIYNFENPANKDQFQQKRAEMLFEQVKPYLESKYSSDQAKLHKALLVNEEKIIKSPQLINDLIFYFYEPKELDTELLTNQKMGVDSAEKAKDSLSFCSNVLSSIEFNNLEEIKSSLIAKIAEAGRKNGEVLWPLRAALTHEQFSVGAFETAWVIGKTETLKRLAEI